MERVKLVTVISANISTVIWDNPSPLLFEMYLSYILNTTKGTIETLRASISENKESTIY